MKAKDYPAFLAEAKRHQEQIWQDFLDAEAKVDLMLKETPRARAWRLSPAAQAHTWDFYFDEIDFG